MSNIKVQCIDQAIGFLNTPVISSGNVNYDTITFDFCSKWDGFGKTAIFYRTKDEVYYQILDDSNTCIIPREVLTEKGTFYIGVFGSKDDVTITSAVLAYKIQEGAVTENTKPTDPTPDIYDQIIAKYGEYNAKLDSQIERMDGLEERLNTGVGDAEKLGGQLPSYYATAQSVTNIANGTTPVGNSQKFNGLSADEFHRLGAISVLPEGADLDTYLTPGQWGTDTNAIAQSIKNKPNEVTTKFRLRVERTLRTASEGYIRQTIQMSISDTVYERIMDNGVFKEWKNKADGGNANTVNGFKVYKSLSELGLTEATATVESIVNAMQNDSMLIHACGASATTSALALPINYGLLQVLKRNTSYADFIYSMMDHRYYGYYNGGSSRKWGGWTTQFFPLTGGAVTGHIKIDRGTNVGAFQSLRTLSSGARQFAQYWCSENSANMAVYDENDTTSPLAQLLLMDSRMSYRNSNGDQTVLHTGNSSPVVPTNVDPGVGASVTYADGTVIFVYEEE